MQLSLASNSKQYSCLYLPRAEFKHSPLGTASFYFIFFWCLDLNQRPHMCQVNTVLLWPMPLAALTRHAALPSRLPFLIVITQTIQPGLCSFRTAQSIQLDLVQTKQIHCKYRLLVGLISVLCFKDRQVRKRQECVVSGAARAHISDASYCITQQV